MQLNAALTRHIRIHTPKEDRGDSCVSYCILNPGSYYKQLAFLSNPYRAVPATCQMYSSKQYLGTTILESYQGTWIYDEMIYLC